MEILICVADIPQTETAVWQGGELAKLTDSHITLLHVTDTTIDRAVGETILEKANQLLSDMGVEKRLRQGDPADEILAEIKARNYDLVILGANQKASLTERLLGSVALRIASQSPISVLITKGNKTELKKILICTGGLDIANPTIETGAWLADRAEAAATLLHVINPAPTMYTGLKRIEESLPNLLQKSTPLARHLRNGAEILDRYGVQAKLEIRYGAITEEILNEATEGDYDLVIVGPSTAGTAGRLRKWLLGDMTREIVERVPCSVMVIVNPLTSTED